MANVLHENKPRWSRWVLIVQTTPSGKTLSVCLVCGRVTPGPSKECPSIDAADQVRRNLDPRIEARWGDVRTCSAIERHINDEIDRSIPEHLKLDSIENDLRSPRNRYCDTCRGYGCQVCLGSGRHW